MKIVTVATRSDAGYFPALKETCEKNGLDLVTLGTGKEWKGFTWRWNLLESYLKTIDPEELVVHVDAFDVVVIPGRSAKTIERRFQRAAGSKRILLSVETPPPNLMMKYVYHRMFDSCGSTHVNGGCYAGKAGALLKMIAFLRSEFEFSDDDDDQQLFAKMCSTQFFADECALDTNSRIFLNVWSKNTFRQGPIAWDSTTARDTCFVHAPANADMRNVLEYYGVRAKGHTTRRGGIAYALNGALVYAKYMWPEYVLVLVVAILVVAMFANKNWATCIWVKPRHT